MDGSRVWKVEKKVTRNAKLPDQLCRSKEYRHNVLVPPIDREEEKPQIKQINPDPAHTSAFSFLRASGVLVVVGFQVVGFRPCRT